MKTGVRALAVGALSSWLAACLLWVDTRGLTGDGPGAAVDAAGGLEDAPIADTKGAEAAVDDAGVRFCIANAGHTLCEDFDQSDALPPWNAPIMEQGNTLVVDQSTVSSPPNALHGTYASGVGGQAYIETALPAGPSATTKITVSLAIAVSSTDYRDGIAVPLVLGLPPSTGYDIHDVYLQIYMGAFQVTEEVEKIAAGDAAPSPTYYTRTITPSVISGVHHVLITTGGQSRALNVAFDGVPLITTTLHTDIPAAPSFLRLGVHGYGLQAVENVYIDDVLVDVQ